MAKILQNIFDPLVDEIAQTYTIESWHVSQSVDAFTAATDYDISVSGSITLVGQMQQGDGTSVASGSFSHAEGKATTSTGVYSHAEGQETQAIGEASHAKGDKTLAIGDYSHAEGKGTKSTGNWSHAEGQETQAIGDYSHTQGIGTIASGSYQHVSGQYNTKGDDTSLLIVGNGTGVSRSDAFKVRMSGSIVLPTTASAVPTWTGVDGEIVAATVTGKYYLYMWMNGVWKSSSFA